MYDLCLWLHVSDTSDVNGKITEKLPKAGSHGYNNALLRNVSENIRSCFF